MNNHLISIIIPCFNVEEYLINTVDSIINQTYQNWELLLVDDGSEDRTSTICDECAKKDKRVKVIHKENGGLVSARNAGYENVAGDWHMYIDGDDWIEADTCEKLVNIINSHQETIDVIFWKNVQEFDGKQIFSKGGWPCKDKEHLYEGDENIELSRNVLNYKLGIATACTKLVRTEYAKLYDLKHNSALRQGMEGIEYSLRVFYYAERTLFVNQYFHHYRYNPSSISKAISEKNAFYITQCVDVMKDDIDGFRNRDVFLRALYQRIQYVLISTALQTYFHPANEDKFQIRKKKYKEWLNSSSMYIEALLKGDSSSMDKKRRITLFCIKCHFFLGVELISKTKQYLLKKGMFNY